MIKDHAGNTPVVYTASEGSVECLKILYTAYKLLEPEKVGIDKAFVLAAENGQREVADLILSHYGADTVRETFPSALTGASKIGNAAIVTRILECGNIPAFGFERALNEAVKNNHPSILSILWEHVPAESRTQLTAKSKRWNALTWASNAGNTSVVNLLLQMGWNPNCTSIDGFTPLMGSVLSGSEETAFALLARGVNPDLSTPAGINAVLIAARNGHTSLVKALLEAGADIESKSSSGEFTALILAAKNGHNAVVKLLLDLKAAVDARADGNFTALALAAREGHTLCARALLEAGADKNLNDPWRADGEQARSPLVLAIENRHVEMVELLLSFGADIEQTDSSHYRSHTPIELAASAGDENIVDRLLNAGAKRRKEAFSIAYELQHNEILGRLMVEGVDVGGILDKTLERNDDIFSNSSSRNPVDFYDQMLATDEFIDWPTANRKTRDKMIGRLLDLNLEVTSMTWSEWPEIIWAADSGNLEEIETQLQNGADVNTAASNGHTALMSAATNGYFQVCEALLAHGANPNALATGCTTLILAARSGHADIVSLLLAKGADAGIKVSSVNSYERRGMENTGWDAYLVAASHGHTDILQSLPEPTFGPDETDMGYRAVDWMMCPGPEMAIYFAALGGHDETVRYLISRGAQVNIAASDNDRPITAAARNGHCLVIETLLEAGATHILDMGDQRTNTDLASPLVHAVQREHLDAVNLLLSLTPPYLERTKAFALTEACATGNLLVVMALLNADTDVSAFPSGQTPPVVRAVESQQMAILEAVIKASEGKEGIHGFMRYSLAMDATGPFSGNALSSAARIGRADMVLALLEAGAGIDITDNNHWSALMTAARSGHRDVVRLLIQRGCKVNHFDRYGRSALGFACDRGDMAMVQDLISAGADVSPDERTTTPLIMAAKKNHRDIAEALIAAGAAVNSQMQDNSTALIEASSRNFPEVTRLLLEAGADVSRALYDDWTPLAIASRDGHAEVVSALLVAGADPNVEAARFTPLALAARNDHLSTVECILNSSGVSVTSSSCGFALLAAARRGHLTTVQKLLSHEVFTRVSCSFYKRAVAAATNNGFEELADKIQQYIDTNSSTPQVSDAPSNEIVDTDAPTGAPAQSLREDTPVNTAKTVPDAAETQNLLFDAISSADNETAKTLLSMPDTSLVGKDKLTALHVAASHGNLAMIEASLDHGIDVNSRVIENKYNVSGGDQPKPSPPTTPSQSSEDAEHGQYLDEVRAQGKSLDPLLCDDCLSMIPAIADLGTQSSTNNKQLSVETIFNSALNKCPGCVMHLRYLVTHFDLGELKKGTLHRSVITHEKGRDGGLGDIFAVQDLFDERSNANRFLLFEPEGAGLDNQSAADVQKRLAQRQRVGSSTLWDFQTLLIEYRLSGKEKVQTCKFVVYAREDDPAATYTTSRPYGKDLRGEFCIRNTRKWIEDCAENHGNCPKIRTPRLPTRVIDVGFGVDVPRLFVSNGEIDRYVALSYCWGKSQPYHLRQTLLEDMISGLDTSRLPKTIIDAIELTRNLGLQYLWVDALCIIQDSAVDMALELRNMSQVYKNAHVTISAASAAKCDDGFLDQSVSPPSPDSQTCNFPFRCENGEIGTFTLEGPIRNWSYLGNSKDTIHDRAWTLQEHWLSPRVLLYGSKGLSWLCHTSQLRYGGPTVSHFTDNLPRLDAFWHEGISISERDLPPIHNAIWQGDPPTLYVSHWSGHQEKFPFERVVLAMRKDGVDLTQHQSWELGSKQFHDMDIEQWRLWESLVSDYTARNLTHASDKLPAVSALASEFGRMSKDEYLAGLWRISLLDNLLWYTNQPHEKPREYRAPSWSWAAVDGRITFIRPRLGWQFSDGAKIKECSVELLDAAMPYGQVANGHLTISARLRPVTIVTRSPGGERRHTGTHVMLDLFTDEKLGSASFDTTEFLGAEGMPPDVLPDVQIWALGLRWGSGPLPLDGVLLVRVVDGDREGVWRRVGAFFIGRIEKQERHRYRWVGVKQTVVIV